MVDITPEQKSEKDERRQHAQDYLETDLERQREWYGKRASAHKAYAHRLGLVVILCGVLIPFVTALKPSGPFDPYDVMVAGLGVAVALAQGILRTWRFDETWIEYRKASERMKREQRLYVNACGDYASMSNEEQRYRTFVDRTESIIAEEQQLYFERREEKSKDDREKTDG